MAKRPELEKFAEKHSIRIGTIADLIQYRNLNDRTIDRVDERQIETVHGDFTLRTYTDRVSDSVHYALSMGEINADEPCLVRVQTINNLRDVFGTERAGFRPSWSIRDAMARIAKEGSGVMVVVDQAESKRDILNQIAHFPEMPPDQKGISESGVYRVVGTGSQILRDLGVGKMRLLSSPIRYNAISGFDLEVVEYLENESE